MAKNKTAENLDATTEEKIKEAARVVFHKKGFAATRTRDIAEEAGINLALLNYYFRSKGRLFEIIMLETVSGFIQTMALALNDEETTLEEKIRRVASAYIDLISKEPDLPIFMLSEIRNNPDLLLHKLPIKQTILGSVFFRQHLAAVQEGKITEPNPLHFLMNLIGLIMFPFIASPMLKRLGDLQDKDFDRLMQERKKLIPLWISAMMKAK
ncbi:TetR/AcrR family transcriptional regulator [Leadbetterella sp. DM7]|uniref:TetR/AcrR family transcriptional regulator n=1 Tax=Leadbetterella sp. DM7 TaxID=3235085 RepID=UPI00349EE2E7